MPGLATFWHSGSQKFLYFMSLVTNMKPYFLECFLENTVHQEDSGGNSSSMFSPTKATTRLYTAIPPAFDKELTTS